MTDTPQDDGPPDIWLEPKCNPERCWCDVDQGDCDECDAKSVQYIRADRIAALRAENEALREAILWAETSDPQVAIAIRDKARALLGNKT